MEPASTFSKVEPAKETGLHPLTSVTSVLVYAGALLWIVWKTAGRQFLEQKWWILAPILMSTLVVFVIPATRRWLARSTAQRRIGVIIFGVIPIVLLSVGAVVLLPEELQAAAIRVIFLVVVCSLPAVMYYLFMATKKYSLLNDFIINLDRLGLRDPRRLPPELVPAGLSRETEEERKNRVYTYIQKFEAVYGAIPTDLGGLVLDPTNSSQRVMDPRMSKMDSSGFASIFTLDTTVPVVLATILITLGWLIALPPVQSDLTEKLPVQQQGQPAEPKPASPLPAGGVEGNLHQWLGAFTPMETPVHFAFIGAYFFALQMLFRRYVRRDLRSSAFIAVSLRVILSVIGTWVVVAAVASNPLHIRAKADPLLDPKALLVLGFAIGVFPRVAWQVVQAAAKRFSGATFLLPSLQAQLPLSDLDGLTVWHEARLEEEDVENIPNMATADLVELMINTRFSPERLIDWVDQAILYTHLGPEQAKDEQVTYRETLRRYGIRTASALIESYRRSELAGDREELEAILPAEAGRRSPVRCLIDALLTSPNLKLIQTWRGLRPYPSAERQGLAPVASAA